MGKNQMAKDASVTLRLSEELKRALQELALDDRRTLSSYIEVLLEKHVDEKLAGSKSHSDRVTVYRAQSVRKSKKRKG
jgi:hypothetical protein